MQNIESDLHEHKKVIRKNAFWLFWGQLVGRLLRTAIIIYSARVLSQESWGAFNYVLSIATFLTVMSDIGLGALLTREASKHPEGKKEYISTAFFIKGAMLLALVAGFIVAVNIFSVNKEVRLLAPIMVFVFTFDAMRDLGAAIARANERMDKEGVNNIITNFFIAILGVAFLYFYKDAVGLSLAYAIGTCVGLVSIAISLKDDIRNIFSHFNRKLVGHIITSAWSFGLIGIMGTIMLNTDIFIIGWLMSLKDVALYSAAQKIIQLIYIAPVIISTAFFPAMAKYLKDKEKFSHLFEIGLSSILTIAVPASIGIGVLARPIVTLIYGPSFDGSTLALILLAPTIAIFSVVVLIGNAIFAYDKPRVYITYALLGIFGNLFFDLIFIPIWGIAGSAFATLLNQILINIYAWREVRKIVDFKFLKTIWKILCASAVLSVSSAAMLYADTNIFLNVAASAILYFAVLFALKEDSLHKFWIARQGGLS